MIVFLLLLLILPVQCAPQRLIQSQTFTDIREQQSHYSRKLVHKRSQNFMNDRYESEADNKADRDLIVGGSLAESNEYQSYAVTDPQMSAGGLCGAVLIHPDVLLSAAHCGDGGVFANGVLMNIGGTDIFGEDAIDSISVVDQLIHPEFNSGTLTNDVMLIKLASPSTAPVSSWNTNPSIPENNEPLTIIGHGRTESGSASSSLLEATVYVVDDDVCSRAYAQSTSTTVDGNIVICAGSDDSATCSGDSGGPLFRNGQVVGVVSFGIVSQFNGRCSSSLSLPSGFTRLSTFSNFIADGICALSSDPPDSCFLSQDEPVAFPVEQPISRPPTAAPVTVTSSPTNTPLQFALTFSPVTSNPVTQAPSFSPTRRKTSFPSSSPSYWPSNRPSYRPSDLPSNIPMFSPTTIPSLYPSYSPIIDFPFDQNGTIGDTRSFQNASTSTDTIAIDSNSTRTTTTVPPIEVADINEDNVDYESSDSFCHNKYHYLNGGFIMMGIILWNRYIPL